MDNLNFWVMSILFKGCQVPVKSAVFSKLLETWLFKLYKKSEKSSLPTKHPTTNNNNVLLFNKITLLDRLMGDQMLAGIILNGFLDDIPKQIETMEQFIDDGDVEGVKRQAHTIKGASANVSADRLGNLAYELEQMGQTDDLEGMKACMSGLHEKFKQVKEVMEASDILSNTDG